MRVVGVLLVCSLGAFGQSGIGAPRAGCTVDGDHNLRMVWGLRGNYIIGEALLGFVETAACSARFTIATTVDALVVIDEGGREVSRIDAPRGVATYAFTAEGAPAYALFQTRSRGATQAHTLLKWAAGEWRVVKAEWVGRALSIADDGRGGLLVLTGSQLLRVREGVVAVVHDFDVPLTSGFVLSDGSVIRGEAGVSGMNRFGDDGLRVSTGDGEYVVDLQTAARRLLPGVAR